MPSRIPVTSALAPEVSYARPSISLLAQEALEQTAVASSSRRIAMTMSLVTGSTLSVNSMILL